MNPVITRRQAAQSYVFHYTAGVYLDKILASGELRPGAAGSGNPNEPGLLWFSRNQWWEPTATKMAVDADGRPKPLTLQQQLEEFGCIRFALVADDRRLLQWAKACRYAGIKSSEQRKLEAFGRRKGGLPSDWLAITTPVPLADLRSEILRGSGWEPIR